MDLHLVRAGLAANASAVPGLNVYGYCPDSITEPCFYPGESEIDFDQTFGGLDRGLVSCYVLTSKADDESGQRALDAYLGRGPLSLKTALQADRTAGGACLDLHVRRVEGYRWYSVGTDDYYGAKLTVFVIGESEG